MSSLISGNDQRFLPISWVQDQVVQDTTFAFDDADLVIHSADHVRFKLSDILIMLDKYQMHRLRELAQNFILGTINLEENPLRHYILARDHNLTRLRKAVLPLIGALDLHAYMTSTDLQVPNDLRRANKIPLLVRVARLPVAVYGVKCKDKPAWNRYTDGPHTHLDPSRCCSWKAYLAAAEEEVKTASHKDILRPELRVQVAMKSQCSDAMHWLMEECREMVDGVRKAVKDVPWDYEEEYEKYDVFTCYNSSVLMRIPLKSPWFGHPEEIGVLVKYCDFRQFFIVSRGVRMIGDETQRHECYASINRK
ncbi:hypothetical protein SISNIDRAFT_463379 [Sistotremastrum niveocremeum HHB9708]|uniref:Uncharacterized protein n=1 Tax=Sistotremastrum niveocremeum HHB9708 TaxID=1314777 RepID=A0A164Y5H5_9AGAM|nr:hypothetical protein SISNIDRAFT_463379 [Sistotremastrum niveocremeum HHB9708]